MLYKHNGIVYKKLTLAQVKAQFRRGIAFNGFIVGCKVNSYHFLDGWHLAHWVACTTLEEFNKTLNSWNYHNPRELGRYAHYYVKVEA